LTYRDGLSVRPGRAVLKETSPAITVGPPCTFAGAVQLPTGSPVAAVGLGEKTRAAGKLNPNRILAHNVAGAQGRRRTNRSFATGAFIPERWLEATLRAFPAASVRPTLCLRRTRGKRRHPEAHRLRDERGLGGLLPSDQ